MEYQPDVSAYLVSKEFCLQLKEVLKKEAGLLTKYAANLGPAPEYLAPSALARELLRMAQTLERFHDFLEEEEEESSRRSPR